MERNIGFVAAVIVATIQVDPLLPGETHGLRLDEYATQINVDTFPDASVSAVFSEASDDQLRDLLVDDRVQIAVRSAWEIVLRSTPRGASAGEPARIDSLAAQRFMGFLEGKLGVNLPEWWEQALQSGERFDTGDLVFDGEPPKSYRKTDDGMWLHERLKRVETGDDSLSLWGLTGREHLQLMVVPAQEKSLWPNHVCALVHDSSVFLIANGPAPTSYPLVCYDIKTGRASWHRSIWVSAAGGWSGSLDEWHFAELLIGRDVVYVIGAVTDTIYINGFRIADGTPLLRFTEAYPQ
ncbi:MAG: hypothetical protein KF861_12510 [Planctomycetaceae bacterium]|nr:hypothetical protein [Planctomycetaceae bacterium]